MAKNAEARGTWIAIFPRPFSFFGFRESGFGLFSRVLLALRGVPRDEPCDEPFDDDLSEEAVLEVDWPELLRADTFPW